MLDKHWNSIHRSCEYQNEYTTKTINKKADDILYKQKLFRKIIHLKSLSLH